MTRNLVPKMAALLLVAMICFCGQAQAEPIGLTLTIQDLAGGTPAQVFVQTVDSEGGVAPSTNWNLQVGAYYLTFTVGVTERLSSPAATRLVLFTNVDYLPVGGNLPPGQLRISLEGSGYMIPSSAVSFLGNVGGWSVNNDGPQEDPTGSITNGTATFQTSINGVGAFGPGGITQTGALYVQPTGGDVVPTLPYTILSTALLTFDGGNDGHAGFSLAGEVSAGQTGHPLESESVPEPTSLFLLGSSLVGLGTVGFRRRIISAVSGRR